MSPRGRALLALVPTALLGVAAAQATVPPQRGTMVDVGGRSLRLVCEGSPGPNPTVVFESGAFGVAADWAAVQAKIAPRMRACAYDRAGLGYSDPGPAPRDSLAIAADLEALLKRAQVTGPLIMVAHSMAPVHAYVFALRHPGRVVGVVLVDAVTPQALLDPTVQRWAGGFARFARFIPGAARVGLLRLLQGLDGDAIGLPEPAKSEKKQAFSSIRHAVWSTAEAELWITDGEEARALGDLDPAIPVAAISAGPHQPNWKKLQAAPALHADRGYVEHVPAANHATLLGPRYNDAIVRGIDFVREAAAMTAR